MGKKLNTWSQSLVSAIRTNAVIIIAYLLSTWFTNAWLMGDTVDYVDSIVAYEHGRYLQFWEFGHLFWRPFGWLAFRIFGPITGLIYGIDERAGAAFTLISINWIGGLVCIVLLRMLLTRVCKKEWIVNLAAIGLLFSSAFLNYGQTGSAYVPGIALILGCAVVLVRHHEVEPTAVNAVISGLCLALAVCLWFPFVLVAPAALTLPLFLFGGTKGQLRASLGAGVVGAVMTLVAYALVIRVLGIQTVEGLKDWITAASHGMNQMRGIPRMVFGFANSLVDLSGEGALFKRYLKQDPFNPVSLSDVLRLSLFKLSFVYIFLFTVFVNLLRTSRGRRILGLVTIDIVPTVIFALFIFEAGDMSRYIATLPVIFLAVAASLGGEKVVGWTRYVITAFIGVLIVTNVLAMSASTLNQREHRVESRIAELVPLLKPGGRVVTSHLQDEINNFTRDFLFNSINRNGNLRYYAVATINTSQVEHWRSEFASMARDAWSHGGDLWLSKRLLTPRPSREWGWVEGDDPRISWADLYGFFSQLEVGLSVGGEDGFVLILPSERNGELLTRK